MKKSTKLLLTALSACTLAFGIFGMASCKKNKKNSGSENSTSTQENGASDLYSLYEEYAQAQGGTPLSYEAWLKNIRGEKGDPGEKGADGYTPYIGKNGNWWIGGMDTGVAASGGGSTSGKSAYEIWLDAGNTGTEEDFLMWLKGSDTHNFGEWELVKDTDDCETDIFIRACEDCGELSLKRGAHSWTNAYDFDYTTHWQYCENCDVVTDRAEHTLDENNVCTACGITIQEQGAGSIIINAYNMPQTVYPQGGDLNLANGKLTVVKDGTVSNIPLNDSQITVTGYDKNTLGEQILTITYEEMTTTLKVTVLSRIVADEYQTQYLVGEEFDYTKGVLTIVHDDGSIEDVDFSDARVGVTGFDGNTVEENQQVTIFFQDGDVSYDVTITVSVYPVESIQLSKMPKLAYKSHETELDIADVFVVLQNGELSRNVPLTADMVTGFDVSAATVEHRETPLKQILTVTYLGQTTTYEIEIQFSDVSLIALRANEMESLTFVDDTLPTGLTATMGENALEAMGLYFELSEKDKTFLSDVPVGCIAKAASIYGLNKWRQAFENYSAAFVLIDDSKIQWNCVDYTATVAAYELLQSDLANTDSIINTGGAVLTSIAANMADLVVYGDQTVADVLAVMRRPESLNDFAEQLFLMITLYDTLKVIPDTWDTATLNTAENKAAIESAWEILNETESDSSNGGDIYTLMSKWRANDDYFDILYTYYYSKGDFEAMDAFKDKHLPYELEELYDYVYNTMVQCGYLQHGMWQYCYDTSSFMYNYDQAVKLSSEILSSDNAMLKALYNELTFDGLVGDGNGGYVQFTFAELLSFFRSTTGGYLYQMGAYVDVAEFEGLWAMYLTVLEDRMEDVNYLGSSKQAAAVEVLLQEYFKLTPLQQFVFMCSVNPYYKPSAAGRLPEYFWDNSGMVYSCFVQIIYEYYEDVLSEDAFDAFVELMLATEDAAKRLEYAATAQYKEKFVESMADVDRTFAALEKADKTAYEQFDDKLGWLYEMYENYATKFESNAKENLGDWQDEFEELTLACYDAYMLGEINKQLEQANVAAYVAAVAKAQKIADKILASGDADILTAYYFDEISVEVSIGQFGGTMDFLIFYIREQYASMMLENGILDYYNEMDMSDFFAELSYLTYNDVIARFFGSEDPDAKFFTDIDQVMKIMRSFRDLTVDQQYFLLSIDNYCSYHNGLLGFAVEVMGEDVANAVYGLTMVERAYVNYAKNPNGEDGGKTYLALLDEILQNFLVEYADMQNNVDATKKSNFNQYFGEMYTYYMEKCAQLGLNTSL